LLITEQLALTGRWRLSSYEFKAMDAADRKEISFQSFDIIVTFAIDTYYAQTQQ